MLSSIQHRIIWLHWLIFRTSSAHFCQEYERVEVSRRIILLSDKSKSEANVIALSTGLKRVGGLDTQVTALGHPSITLAWHDSIINTWLQQVYWPSHYNRLKDWSIKSGLAHFNRFSEVFYYICCPQGLMSTHLKVHQTLAMKNTFTNKKLDVKLVLVQ